MGRGVLYDYDYDNDNEMDGFAAESEFLFRVHPKIGNFGMDAIYPSNRETNALAKVWTSPGHRAEI